MLYILCFHYCVVTCCIILYTYWESCSYAKSDSLYLPHLQLMDKLNTDTEQAAVIADTTAVYIPLYMYMHKINQLAIYIRSKVHTYMHTLSQLKMQNDMESRNIGATFAERQQ